MNPNENPDPEFNLKELSEDEWVEMFERKNSIESIATEMDIAIGDFIRFSDDDTIYKIVHIDRKTASVRVEIVYLGQEMDMDLINLYEQWRRGKIIPVKVTFRDAIS